MTSIDPTPAVRRDATAVVIAFVLYNVAIAAIFYPLAVHVAEMQHRSIALTWAWVGGLDAISIIAAVFLARQVLRGDAVLRRRYWVVVLVAFIANIGLFGLLLAVPLAWFVHRRLDSDAMREHFSDPAPLPWLR